MPDAPSLISVAFYRYSRSLTLGIGGTRIGVSATPRQYARLFVNVGRWGFHVEAGRRIEREQPGTDRGYKHTRIGIRCEFGWVAKRV